MTEQEKELIDMFFGHLHDDGSHVHPEYDDLAKAIIQRYPQILAEKVGDWDYELTKRGSRKYYFFTENPVESIFIREVVS